MKILNNSINDILKIQLWLVLMGWMAVMVMV